jgi:hypothetical protein
VWEMVDAMPEHLRPAVLLGAFAGLRVGEVCGLRLADVDFVRGVVYPKVQFKSMTETAAPENEVQRRAGAGLTGPDVVAVGVGVLAWMHRCGMGLGWVVAAKCPVVVEE